MAKVDDKVNMLDFDIQMLKRKNINKKNMLINVKLDNLTMYYTQQCILRLIAYINTQMTPSFKSKLAR